MSLILCVHFFSLKFNIPVKQLNVALSCLSLFRKLLPPDVILSLGIHTISFNPVTVTNIVKVISGIVRNESSSASSGIRIPDKESLTALAESSNGDIRGAINAIQFACLRGGTGEKKRCGRRFDFFFCENTCN